MTKRRPKRWRVRVQWWKFARTWLVSGDGQKTEVDVMKPIVAKRVVLATAVSAALGAGVWLYVMKAVEQFMGRAGW